MKKYIKPIAEAHSVTTQDILMTSPGYIGDTDKTVGGGSELSREQKNGWNGGLWEKKW